MCKKLIQTDFQSLYRITVANPDPEVGIVEQYVTLLYCVPFW